MFLIAATLFFFGNEQGKRDADYIKKQMMLRLAKQQMGKKLQSNTG